MSKFWTSLIQIYLLFRVINMKLIVSKSIDNSKHDNVVKCTVTLANNQFDYRKHTAVYYDIDFNIVNKFLASYKGSVTIETKKDAVPTKQVIVLVDTFYSFIKTLNKLKPDLRGKTLLRNGAKFIIIILNPKRLHRVTSILWSYYVTNVIIITRDNNSDTIYTYFPYINHLDCQNTQPTVVSFCTENVTHEDIFLDKMSNMHGCPLYISTEKLYYPSIEQKIPLQVVKKTVMRLLRDKMNFTPITSNKDYISMDPIRAQNWSDSLHDVITGTANISTCSIPLAIDKSGLLDYSPAYFRIRFAWFAPPISTGPVIWRLLSPLNGYLWLILLIVIVVVKSIPIIFRIKSVTKLGRQHFKNFDKLRGVVLRTWGMLMGQPIRVAPRRFRDMYIISLWLFFTFVVRSAYQSVLIVSLKTDSVTGVFTKLEEIIDHGYRFGGRAGFLDRFEQEPIVKENFEIIADLEFDEIFWDVVEGKKRFVVAASLEYAWAFCLSRGKKENECGQVLLDSILTVPLVIWMKRNSPFAKSISLWLGRIIESGLLNKELIGTIEGSSTTVTLKSSDPTALTSKQFASCLLCFLLGIMISTTIFILEIIKFKVSQRRPKKRVRFAL